MLGRVGDLVVEPCRDHRRASSSARQTRSGVAGSCRSLMPNWDRQSTTAFITHTVEAIVPVSHTPLTPMGFVGLGLSVRAVSNEMRSAAEGTREPVMFGVVRVACAA